MEKVMVAERQDRRLTTILAADVVGYSRLMSIDETDTLSKLKQHRRELIEPMAKRYGGRTVKLMGEGSVMEFGSGVDAVLFAVDVQCAGTPGRWRHGPCFLHGSRGSDGTGR